MAGGGAAEKLTFFWHGHWATSVAEGAVGAADAGPAADLPRLRARATSSPLVRAMLRDPALILWLDGQRNTRKAPNENLARELMELFTLGIGDYTEDDVKAGARALTGWQSTAPPAPRGCVPQPPRRRRQDDARADRPVRRRRVRRPAGAGTRRTRRSSPAGCGSGSAPAVVPRRPRRLAATDRAATSPRCCGRCSPTRRSPATRGQLVKQPVEWLVGAMRQLGIDLPSCRSKQRNAMLGGLRRARPGAVPAAQRRRLAVRRGLADHVVAAGPAAARRRRWPRWRPRPVVDRLARGGEPARRAGPAARRRRLDRPDPRGADRRVKRAAAAARARPGQPRVHRPLRRIAHGHHHPAQVPDRQRRRRRRRARRRRDRVRAAATSSATGRRPARPDAGRWCWSRCTAATTA